MNLFLFAQFHAREGQEGAVEAALRGQVPKVRGEPGCLSIDAYRSTRDPRRFWITSRWTDEAAFDVHAELPNTLAFIERMEFLIDHPFDAKRANVLT
jgi:quinol monooxygenase YgiN